MLETLSASDVESESDDDLPWPEQRVYIDELSDMTEESGLANTCELLQVSKLTQIESLFSRPNNTSKLEHERGEARNRLTSHPFNFTLLNPNKFPAANSDLDSTLPPISEPKTNPNFPKNSPTGLAPVTKVLRDTMSPSARFYLERWRCSMIDKLGLEGFVQYRREIFGRAMALHAILAKYLLGLGEPTFNREDPAQQVVMNLWKSIENFVRHKITNIRLVEHIVTHESMNYRGVVDCVAIYNNELVVIDFKTAEKLKTSIQSIHDNPLQVTAYCGALNNDSKLENGLVNRNVCSALVVVAYIDGSEATVHHLSLDEIQKNYWEEWTSRLDQYNRASGKQK